MKNKKIITIFMLLLFFIINYHLFNNVYAETLSLNILTDKDEVKNGEEIKIKVVWNKEMQAADYYLNYDSSKLEYIKSDIDDVYINNISNEGKIKTAWFSMDDSKRTSIEYTFKVKNNGILKFTTNINGGFATEKMEVPDEYKEGELIIGKQENYSYLYIIIVVAIFIIIFLIYKNGVNKKKEKNKNEKD